MTAHAKKAWSKPKVQQIELTDEIRRHFRIAEAQDTGGTDPTDWGKQSRARRQNSA